MAYDPNTLSFTVPETDMVYIDGLPPGVSEEDVATHFATIGVLKHDKKKGGPKIWLYRDKATGALKVGGITCQAATLRPARSASQLTVLRFFQSSPWAVMFVYGAAQQAASFAFALR